MKDQRSPAHTPAGKHVKVVALTVTLCVVGMGTSAQARAAGAAETHRELVSYPAHVTRPFFHVRSPHVPAYGPAKLGRVVGQGTGCQGSSSYGLSPTCWQSSSL